jgi:16S rRNA processing protein RimM
MQKKENSKAMKNIGTIMNTKGIDGTLIAVNSPQGIILSKGKKIFIGFSENFTEEFLLSKDFATNFNKSELNLIDINDKEKAAKFKEKAIFALKSDILSENENYIFPDEIIDCSVFDIENNSEIGKITEVWNLPANDVWLVQTESGDLPLPVISDVIKEIDIENKTIKVFLLDGLMELLN